MKKIKYLAIAAMCALSLSANAVYGTDGSKTKYQAKNVEKIEFLEEEKSDDHNGHEYVDLGLSVKWATMNIGASKPEDCGYYFAWGETTTKTTYNWSTYKWCNGSESTMTKYCPVDNKTTLELTDDAAHVNWGGSWRMPTKAEQDELRTKCTWTWTTQGGMSGYKVTSKTNGNSIFLTAAGHRYGSYLDFAGLISRYWSSSLITIYPYRASYLSFDSGNVGWYYGNRSSGQSVRAVCP